MNAPMHIHKRGSIEENDDKTFVLLHNTNRVQLFSTALAGSMHSAYFNHLRQTYVADKPCFIDLIL